MFRLLFGTLLPVIILVGCNSNTENCAVKDIDISGKYYGQCSSGLANGVGKAQGRDSYVGEFKAGKKHGKGEYKWGEKSDWVGNVFTGDWQDDEQIFGEYRLNSKIVLRGNFHNSELNGFGVVSIPNASLIGKHTPEHAIKREDVHEISGHWHKGDFSYPCESQDKCDKHWKQVVGDIEKYIAGNDVTAGERFSMEFVLLVLNCTQKFVDKYSIEKCVTSTRPLFAAVQREDSIRQLNEIRAGLIPVGAQVTTVGIGKIMQGFLLLTGGYLDINHILVRIDKIPSEKKLKLMNECSDIFSGCNLVLIGVIRELGVVPAIDGFDYILVEELKEILNYRRHVKNIFEKMKVDGPIYDYIADGVN